MQGYVQCLALLFIVLATLLPSQFVLITDGASIALQTSADELIAAVNALRIANGLPAYAANPILMQVAQDQANYMAATGQVAHRPGLTQRILDAGYPLAGDLSAGGFRAENITGGNKTASQAVQEWSNDALHLNTMLSPDLTEIGAGVAMVSGRHYLVIDCARPTASGQPQSYTPVPGETQPESYSLSDFIVPITTSTPDVNGVIYHEVQPGQTLWAIAIEYGVKIDEIRALNNLGSTIEIYPGDRLLVRMVASSSDAPVPLTSKTTVPTGTVQTATSTSMPTATLLPTKTLPPSIQNSRGNSGAGIALGIALATVIFVGLLTWIRSRWSS